MKRYQSRALMAGALCLALTAQAGALSVSGVAGLGASAAIDVTLDTLEREGINAVPPVQDAQNIGFIGLEKTVRANNLTIQSFHKTLAGIANTDLDAQFFMQEMQYQAQLNQYKTEYDAYDRYVQALQALGSSDGAVQAQLQLAMTLRTLAQKGMESMQMTIDGLDDAQEAAQDQLDETYAETKAQLDNTANQIVVGAQTAYLGIISTREGIETLDRNLAALDRQIAAVEKQVELGMAAPLTLENLQQSRRSVVAQRETLELVQQTAENQLSLLCGNTAGTTVKPTVAPTVTSKQLSDMNYTTDLAQAMENSYSIWSAQNAVRKASNDYEDDVTSTVDAYEAAKLTLENTEESVTNSFRQMYLDVQDKKRLLDEAQAAYDMEEKNFAVDQLQYDRGMISQMDYLTAQDDLAAKQDAVTTAEHDLFTAYNTYDWARRGYMSGV
ncbi:MAG TPA: TolC family protein [Candidatus Agathobaculum merdavium]|nr:TolC family protein [Candidatus Agathobaculum merdavium]